MPAESKFEVYKDNAGKFRWRLRASNDEEIVRSRLRIERRLHEGRRIRQEERF